MGMNEDFWGDLLGHIRHQVLVPVVGPDLTVVKVGDTEQTFTTLIGQRLAERYRPDRVARDDDHGRSGGGGPARARPGRGRPVVSRY